MVKNGEVVIQESLVSMEYERNETRLCINWLKQVREIPVPVDEV